MPGETLNEELKVRLQSNTVGRDTQSVAPGRMAHRRETQSYAPWWRDAKLKVTLTNHVLCNGMRGYKDDYNLIKGGRNKRKV